MEDIHVEVKNTQDQNRNTVQNEIVSVKDWFVTLLILTIPVVGFVMLFVWAFGANTNPSKANFFKAQLLVSAIVLGIMVIFGGAIVGSIISSISGGYYY